MCVKTELDHPSYRLRQEIICPQAARKGSSMYELRSGRRYGCCAGISDEVILNISGVNPWERFSNEFIEEKDLFRHVVLLSYRSAFIFALRFCQRTYAARTTVIIATRPTTACL